MSITITDPALLAQLAAASQHGRCPRTEWRVHRHLSAAPRDAAAGVQDPDFGG